MVTLTRKRALLGLVFCLMYVAKIDVSGGSRCILVYVKGKPGNPVIRALVLICTAFGGSRLAFLLFFLFGCFRFFYFPVSYFSVFSSWSFLVFFVWLEEEPQYIIEVGPNQQTEKENHSRHLSVFHELVARFATGYHLIEQE